MFSQLTISLLYLTEDKIWKFYHNYDKIKEAKEGFL